MKPLEYLHLQLRLEGKEVLAGNRLRQVEIVSGEEMPLMIVAQLAGGQTVVYRDEALPPELWSKLGDQAVSLAFPGIDPLLDFLRSAGMPVEVGHYRTYIFPARFAEIRQQEVKILERENPLVQEFGFGGFARQVFTIERNGKIVSACVSTRENAQCAEAWVFTDTQYRHHGFARQVVSAWAQEVARTGKVPFYSHKIENLASANLAMRLGLEPVFEEISISYASPFIFHPSS